MFEHLNMRCFILLSSPIVMMMTMLMMLVTSTWHPWSQRPWFRFKSRILVAASPCLIMGIRGHWVIILTPIWWFRTLLLLTLPTTVPTCFFMTNEHKARMQMCCATCGLRTIPISSRWCLNANRRCPRSWWSSSTIVSGRTSRNLSCNFLPYSPSRSTLRLCWFIWSLDIPTTLPIGSSSAVAM